MKIKNIEINFNEGIYRLFIILSFIGFFFGVFYEFADLFYQKIFVGIVCFLLVYISFFVLEWIYLGFFKNHNEYKGVRGFVKRIFSKLFKNCTIPFWVLLITSAICAFYYLCNLSSMNYKLNTCRQELNSCQNEVSLHY